MKISLVVAIPAALALAPALILVGLRIAFGRETATRMWRSVLRWLLGVLILALLLFLAFAFPHAISDPAPFAGFAGLVALLVALVFGSLLAWFVAVLFEPDHETSDLAHPKSKRYFFGALSMICIIAIAIAVWAGFRINEQIDFCMDESSPAYIHDKGKRIVACGHYSR